jgi:microcystin-dependent protein
MSIFSPISVTEMLGKGGKILLRWRIDAASDLCFFPGLRGTPIMAEPFLGEIRIVSFNFAPKGWAMANGQLLPINQNQALFALFGTTYGGDGRVTFAIPDLRGRTPISFGNSFTLGQRGGEEAHTITMSEMPQHFHGVNGTTTIGTVNNGNGNLLGVSQTVVYNPAVSPVALDPTSVTNTGGSQPHINLQPYLTLTLIVALQGIFPSQN